jgi:hypothetical protein
MSKGIKKVKAKGIQRFDSTVIYIILIDLAMDDTPR